jgi:ribosomal protein L21E
MKNPCLTLLFAAIIAAPASAQVPGPVASPAPTPSPAPRPPQAPDRNRLVEDVRDIDIDIDLDLDDIAEIRESARRLALSAMMQIPVPPVPPVPPVNPRTERDRERERERAARQARERQNETTEPYSRAFKVGKGAALTIENPSGNIQVTAGTGEQIDVQARKRAWGPDPEQAKRRLADSTIEAYASGNRVDIRVEHSERGSGRGVEVEFDVKVPPDTSLDLRSASGDVRVTNVNGEVRLQAVSGNVLLEGTPRLVMVRAVSGDVTMTNAGSETQLSVSTVSGSLLLQTLKARSLDLNTVSGDVRITGWSGERSFVRTLSGNLELDGSLSKGGRYDFESHSGDMRLTLPEQPGFDLEANTFSGGIRVDFPIKSEGPVRDVGRGPRALRGVYGDASATLRVQTFSGSLTIARR